MVKEKNKRMCRPEIKVGKCIKEKGAINWSNTANGFKMLRTAGRLGGSVG